MNDLSHYLDQKSEIERLSKLVESNTGFHQKSLEQEAEIKRLNKQINMVATFYRNFFLSRINELEKKHNRLSTRVSKLIAAKDMYKGRNETKLGILARLKHEGSLSLSCEEIAELVYCQPHSVMQKVTNIKKENKND